MTWEDETERLTDETVKGECGRKATRGDKNGKMRPLPKSGYGELVTELTEGFNGGKNEK